MRVRSGRRQGAWWREAAITATAGAVCLVGAAVRPDGTLSPPDAAAWLIAVVSCGVLPLRHRAPPAVLLVTTVAVLPAQPLGLLLSPLIEAAVVVAAYGYALTARTEVRAAVAVLLTSGALLAAAVPSPADQSWQDAGRIGAVAAFPLVAGVLGHSVRTRRAYLAAVEDRARRAERSREDEARRRVAEERLRIARELHDLVAHQITLANAQATVAAHLFDVRPEQTRRSLTELVETTAQALDELRATVGLLRSSGDPDATAEPAPGLSRLPTLLDSFRRAGLAVSVDEDGPARPLPPGVDLTAYRIIQEALTNVTKHAGTDRARVRLSWDPERVTITITDDGPGARTAPDRAPGYGLIGMAERAAAAGGSIATGRRPGGGFQVRAELPVPSRGENARP
ncbi:sensor histidine kinase [Catenuloplanes atrovinosus]|uniref:histidine kinase n=1 Tax=Catenuloplanes atrovinosus TaxID=137266 RepID=A0AAE3YK43_9ACTN|nr:sensor histidine kinase [Catenuloplanes atrovinosus]MDR7275239.1 signal transduction histidine kinase [Catenuloplanes atrovinosus]